MTVTSVERAFLLLRAVPTSDGTLSGLSRETGLPVATVSRLMSALEQAGAVLRNEKTYRIGPAVVELAGDDPAAYDLLALATSHLSALAAETHETAGIAEAAGTDLVHLGQIETDHDVSVRDWTGFRAPAHSGAIGFVLMAHWDRQLIDRYLLGDLEAFSPHTLTDPAAVRERLDQIRDQGWCWSTDEYALGVTTVAAPVFGRDGAPVAALHVHGPSYRFPGDRDRAAIGGSVRERADAISVVLGFRHPRWDVE